MVAASVTPLRICFLSFSNFFVLFFQFYFNLKNKYKIWISPRQTLAKVNICASEKVKNCFKSKIGPFKCKKRFSSEDCFFFFFYFASYFMFVFLKF